PCSNCCPAGEATLSIASRPHLISREESSMLPDTLTQLSSKRSVCRPRVTSICAAQPPSCRACVPGLEAGEYPQQTYIRKSLAHWILLPPAWHKFITLRIRRREPWGPGPQYRLPAVASPLRGTQNSRAYSNWQKPATYPCGGRAVPASAIPA